MEDPQEATSINTTSIHFQEEEDVAVYQSTGVRIQEDGISYATSDLPKDDFAGPQDVPMSAQTSSSRKTKAPGRNKTQVRKGGDYPGPVAAEPLNGELLSAMGAELRVMHAQLDKIMAGQASMQQAVAQVRAAVGTSALGSGMDRRASESRERRHHRSSRTHMDGEEPMDPQDLRPAEASQAQDFPGLQAQLNRLAATQEEIKEAVSRISPSSGHKLQVQHGLQMPPVEEEHSHKIRPSYVAYPPTPKTQEVAVYRGPYAPRLSSLKRTNTNSSIMKDEVQQARVAALKSVVAAGTDRSSNFREEAVDLAKQEQCTKLKQVFDTAESFAREKAEQRRKSYLQRYLEMPPGDKANIIDLFMGIVICTNMVVIGISMDTPTNAFLMFLDVAFSLCFIVEVILKASLFGPCGHFCPRSPLHRIGVLADSTLVAVDLVQLCVQFIEMIAQSEGEEEGEGGMRTSVLRILRLMRLTRMIRVLRLEMFQDLILMITGMAVGMPTLVWAIILFMVTIYVVALCSRLAFGSGGPAVIRNEFETVDNALFAVFRCSFGDCTTQQGTSLLGVVIDYYGPAVGLFCSLFIFFVTIGLFNVISAIFVEATLSAKMKAATDKKRAKLCNYPHFATHMKILIERVVQYARGHEEDHSEEFFAAENFSEWSTVEVPTHAFKSACLEDEEVQNALRELDIHEGDFAVLADILDPQNDYHVSLKDILEGITRLRGDPRRSDIVTVDLMIRDIQQTVCSTRTLLKQLACASFSALGEGRPSQ